MVTLADRCLNYSRKIGNFYEFVILKVKIKSGTKEKNCKLFFKHRKIYKLYLNEMVL